MIEMSRLTTVYDGSACKRICKIKVKESSNTIHYLSVDERDVTTRHCACKYNQMLDPSTTRVLGFVLEHLERT